MEKKTPNAGKAAAAAAFVSTSATQISLIKAHKFLSHSHTHKHSACGRFLRWQHLFLISGETGIYAMCV